MMERRSATGCAHTRPVSPIIAFMMNRAGMKIMPRRLKFITSEAVAAPMPAIAISLYVKIVIGKKKILHNRCAKATRVRFVFYNIESERSVLEHFLP